MTYSSRFFLYAPIALFLAVAGFVCLLWWQAAGAAEARLAAIKGRPIVPGVTLDWSGVVIGGFPFRVDATFENFSARGEGPHGPFRWDSPHVAFHTLTYRSQRAVFEAAGAQRLSWVDAAGRSRHFAFQPGTLHASTIQDANGLARFDVDVAQLTAAGFTAGRVQFHLRRADRNRIDMVASADGVKGELGVFGTEARSLRLFQTLTQAGAFAPMLQGDMGARTTHAAWTAQGGKAGITRSERNGQQGAMTPQQAAAITALLEALY